MKKSINQQRRIIDFGKQISAIGLLVVVVSLLILMVVHWMGMPELLASGKHLFWFGVVICAIGAALWGATEN